MGNVHQQVVKWSKIIIDADKDMDGKSLTNLNDVEFTRLITQTDYIIEKSPDRNSIRIVTPAGFLDIAPAGSYHAHFYTDRPSFYFDKPVYVNGNVFSYLDKQYDLGSILRRWGNAYIGRNLGLGVIKSPGSTLTVDVIYDDAYTEIASDLTERVYTLVAGQSATDWDIGTLSTLTENGIITGIKLQIDAYATTLNALYKLFEDGVEIASFYCGNSTTYSTYSIEVNTLKNSATYSGVVVKLTNDGDVGIKNRYLYFRKRYLGIKAGQ